MRSDNEAESYHKVRSLLGDNVWGKVIIGIFVASLIGYFFTLVFEALADPSRLGDLIASSIVLAIIIAGFFFFRWYFKNFDLDDMSEPPFGWAPTLSEEQARSYRGYQMKVNEQGQLVPIKIHEAISESAAAQSPTKGTNKAGTGRGSDATKRGGTQMATTRTAASGVNRKGRKRKVLAAPQAGKAVDTQVEVGPLLSSDGTLPTPLEIYNALGEYVIGQEEARRTLSVAVYNHYKRTAPNGDKRIHKSDVEIAKSNIMLLGPTGSGKTLMVQTLARILDVPLAISDATTLTDAGYVGDDVESMLGRLIAAAGSSEAASMGIVYVDEIDKIARGGGRQGSFSLNGDPSGEGVQQAMLKLLEGTQAKVPPLGGRTNLFQRDTQLDTTNILFICGGAFVGLTDIIRKRTTNSSIGFAATSTAMSDLSDDELLAMVEPEDLHRFGLIPEFVGRIPVITYTSKLDAPAMVRILTEPRNALVRQYQELFAYDGVELDFDQEALEAIGEQAIGRGTGARGLRSICERVLRDAMFEVPGRSDIERVVVHASCVTDGDPVEYVLKQDRT